MPWSANGSNGAMAKEGLCRMVSLGLPVDPHSMTVVEVVDGEGHAPGTVVEEIRPGYRWNGKVVRYAEVRAARPALNLEPSATDGKGSGMKDEG